MRLRTRLAVTLLLLTVPFAVGLSAVTAWWRQHLALETIVEELTSRMDGVERDRCEESPESWPEPRRGRRRGRLRPRAARAGAGLHAYGVDFVSRNPAAPSFDRELRAAMEAGESVAMRRAWVGRREVALIAARMPWDDGPCAIVVVRRPAPPGGSRGFVAALWPSLLVSAAAVLVAFLAAGPLVRRTRRLTERVRRAGEGVDEPVTMEGSDEFAELSLAFEGSRRSLASRVAELEQRDAALTAFLANTTHDVMLPLTVLSGHISAIRRHAERGEVPPRELVRDAFVEAHYMASLIHNLSAATRLEAGVREPVRHPVDMNALVERVVARNAPFARERGVALEHAVPERPVVFVGDVTLLEQMLGNLAHNAIRYNDEGGHVAIVLEPHGEGAFVARVLDDGPGIPPDRVEELLRPRVRGDAARTRDPRGMGLGLAIAREAAARHGLALTLAPGPEGGLVAEVAPAEGAGAADAATGAVSR